MSPTHLPKTVWDKLGRGHKMIRAADTEETGQGKGNQTADIGETRCEKDTGGNYMHELRELKTSDCRLKRKQVAGLETGKGCKRNWAAAVAAPWALGLTEERMWRNWAAGMEGISLREWKTGSEVRLWA